MQKLFFKKGLIFFWLIAIGWIAFVANYLCISGWWQTRGSLAPVEVVGSLGGLAMPLVLLFLVASFFDRSERVEQEARQVRAFMEELIYPSEEGAVYTQELTANLAKQIKEFRSVYTGVTEHTDAVKENLQRWIEGLNKLVKTVDTQTVSAVQKMAAHIEKLAEITHQSNRQAEQTTALLAGQADILNDITKKTNTVMTTFSKESLSRFSGSATECVPPSVFFVSAGAFGAFLNSPEIARILSDSGMISAETISPFSRCARNVFAVHSSVAAK